MIARLTIVVALLALSASAIGQEPAPPTESGDAQSASPAESPKPADAEKPAAEISGEPASAGQASAGQPSAEPASGAPSSNQPAEAEAAAPVNEDREARAARLKDLLSLVRDNTLRIHKRENPAYFMLMKEVLDRTPEQLRNEITTNPRFHDLYTKPSEHRGELIHVRLNARRVLPIDIAVPNVASATRLYEIWGWTEEAKAWMYCCVVPELPPGFPEEGDVSESIELTGYFFKMQAYQPGNAAPNARDLVAPLVIGRVVQAPPVRAEAGGQIGNWPYILIIGFGCIVMFRIMLHVRGMGRTPPVRRNYRRRSLEPIDPDLLGDGLEAPERGIRIRNANEV